ncbi:MAG: signal peptidase I [Promicromonosporaceae bacterium]|nr:signal peptidase I [Promicromonosporaceae bacterium]
MNKLKVGGQSVTVGGKKIRVGRAWYDSPWKIAGAAFSIVLGVLFAAITVLMFVVPAVMGGASLTVLTGSMRPSIHEGDVIVVRGIAQEDVCREIGVGHVITFFPEPGRPDLITHRVVSKSAGAFPDGTTCRFITRGDDNTADDPPVSPAQVRGVLMYTIPRLGHARDWVGNQPQTIVIAAVVIILTYVIWTWLRPAKKTARVLTGAEAAAMGVTAGAAPSGQDAIQQGLSTQGLPSSVMAVSGGGLPMGTVSATSDPAVLAMQTELLRRELAIRERELAIREVELGMDPAPAYQPPTPEPEPEPKLDPLSAALMQAGIHPYTGQPIPKITNPGSLPVEPAPAEPPAASPWSQVFPAEESLTPPPVIPPAPQPRSRRDIHHG